MSPLLAKDVEIVGLNGAPLVECGRALPIVRRKHDATFSVLDLSRGSESLVWHSSEEAAEFANAQRWSELSKPLTVPKACVDEDTGEISAQPMIIFENETLLDVAERIPRPDHAGGEYLIWQALKRAEPEYFATAATGDVVEKMLDDWSCGLLKRFDAMIGRARDRADLKRIADFALCAARSRPLRWKAYLRFAATQEPDKMSRTFDRFIHPEFPSVSWDGFIAELKKLRDVWDAQPTFQHEGRSTSTESTASKVKGIAQASSPILVRND